MTNPYQAPLEEAEVKPVPPRRMFPFGCGCAVIALVSFLCFGFLTLSVSRQAPRPLVPKRPAPTTAPSPAPPTPAPQPVTQPLGE